MDTRMRSRRLRGFQLESLETRNLLSTLIGSKPTLEALASPNVELNSTGGITILQPTSIQLVGTAQPGPAGSTTKIEIYGQDSHGTIINGGAPLATVQPDFLGRYSAIVSLPSLTRADYNYLIARQTTTANEVYNLNIDPTTLNNFTATVNLDPGTISGLTGSIANPDASITNLGGVINTAATPISNIGGTITTPAFPIVAGLSSGTAGPAVSTLIGGTGTLGAQLSLLSNATGTINATVSTFTQTGTAVESARTGTVTNGTGDIAATTGTASRVATEVAVSDPLVVGIHQPRTGVQSTVTKRAATRTKGHPVGATIAHVKAVRAARAARMAALRAR